MPFAFTADCHLAGNAWASLPAIVGDAYNSFNQIVTHCLDKRAQALVLGGDNVDSSRPSAQTALHLFDEGRRLRELPVCFIQGQHCRTSPPWPQLLMSGRSLHKQRFNLCGHPTAGFDHLPADELQAELAALPDDVEILVLHQMCRQAISFDSWDFDASWLKDREKLKLVLMGDYHKVWNQKIDSAGGPLELLYPGSIAMQSQDEDPEKSFVWVNDDLTWERVPLQTRPFRRLTLLIEDDVKAAEKELAALQGNSVGGPLAFVEYQTGLSAVEERLVKAFQGVLVLSARPAELLRSGIKPDNVTLAGCLGSVLKREEDPGLYEFLVELLGNAEPAAVLDGALAKLTKEGACA